MIWVWTTWADVLAYAPLFIWLPAGVLYLVLDTAGRLKRKLTRRK